jgi:hypothetical protein
VSLRSVSKSVWRQGYLFMSDLLLPLSLLPVRLTAIGTMAFGLIYFFKKTPMGFHQRFLQTPFSELPTTSQGLILKLLHATGCGLIAIGLTLGYLVWGPIPAKAPGSLATAFILVTSTTIPMTAILLSVGRYTPWWLIMSSGLCSVWGLWCFSASWCDGPLFNGDRYSLVDAAYAPFLQRYLFLDRVKSIGHIETFPRLKAWAETLIKRPSTHSFPPDEFEALYHLNLKRRNKWVSQFLEGARVAAE